ncbi:hypothetical protein [Rhizorhabdus dicambivorans]|uniref:hypothetical protein n=1 Tax=Rhizorhabdus dicambivorans TaxID=1850238 RepID=UPI0011123D20|nr:hypothetical protein [Rhizorhabdus dicambivorans]
MPIIVMAVLRGSMRQPHQFLARHDYRRINLKSLNRPRAVPALMRERRTRAREGGRVMPIIYLKYKGFSGAAKSCSSNGRTRQKIAVGLPGSVRGGARFGCGFAP